MRIVTKSLVLLVVFSGWAYGGSLSVLSWNVYYDDDTGEERYPKIMKQLAASNADVVCLQEVTSTFSALLKRNRQLQEYKLITESRKKRYGNAFLIKKALGAYDSDVIPLPSNMQRSGLSLSVQWDDVQLTMINLHLESMMGDTEVRIRQLETIRDYAERDNYVVLCGDFNFGDKENDDQALGRAYVDTGKVHPIPTYDVDRNDLADETKFFFEKSRRLDRIYIKGDINATMYRVHQVSGSDHYPVSVRLEVGGVL